VSLISKYREVLTDLVRALTVPDIDATKISEFLDWFYEEGWDVNFSDEKYGLFGGGEAIKKALSLKNKLQSQGENIDALSQTLNSNLKGIWTALPDFYSFDKSHKVPTDYNPQNPFPNLLVSATSM
jgi:hypothetical protein